MVTFPCLAIHPYTGFTFQFVASNLANTVDGRILGRFPMIPPPVMCATPRMPETERNTGRRQRTYTAVGVNSTSPEEKSKGIKVVFCKIGGGIESLPRSSAQPL